jgi:hypothetical protein
MKDSSKAVLAFNITKGVWNKRQWFVGNKNNKTDKKILG